MLIWEINLFAISGEILVVSHELSDLNPKQPVGGGHQLL